jgi:hypothetical protein
MFLVVNEMNETLCRFIPMGLFLIVSLILSIVLLGLNSIILLALYKIRQYIKKRGEK